jgi:hypothetical protein
MAFINYWEQHGVIRIFSGFIDGQQVLDSVVSIEEDSRFDLVRYVINDFLDVADFDISDEEIVRIAAIDRAASVTNPNIRIALVAQDDRIRGLAERYGNLMQNSPYKTSLFTSVEAAREWI